MDRISKPSPNSRGRRVRREIPDPRVPVVSLESMVRLDFQGILGHKVPQVPRVHRGVLVQLVPMVRMGVSRRGASSSTPEMPPLDGRSLSGILLSGGRPSGLSLLHG